MKAYTVYNQQTSKIVKSGVCPDDMMDIQTGGDASLTVIEGHSRDDKQKVVNGRIVDKTHAEIEADKFVLPVIPEEDRSADITKGQLNSILENIELLRARINR